MKKKFTKYGVLLVCLVLLTGAFLPFAGHQNTPKPAPVAAALPVTSSLRPLVFEANQGQTDEQVKFLVRGRAQVVFLTPTEVVMKLSQTPAGENLADTSQAAAPENGVLRLQFMGASPNPPVVGVGQLPGVANYYLGSDPAGWQTGVPTYAGVRYQDLYPGIDMLFYGNDQELEHDFVVAPGSSPEAISIRVAGAAGLRLDEAGNLMTDTAGSSVMLRRPFIYQEKNGKRSPIEGEYVLTGPDTFSFSVAAYDAALPLVIDPVIDFSTYFGGSGADYGYGIATDPAGNIYLTGATNSPDFPQAEGYAGAGSRCPSDLPTRECFDAFVTKINAAGTAILYSTYIGNPGEDEGRAIAVDAAGNAYITGLVSLAGDYPNDELYIYGYTLVAKLDPTGGMIYGFAWGDGATSSGHGIAVDGQGQAYIVGEVFGTIATTPNAVQPEKGEMTDGFITVISADGQYLIYSTYLGGNETYCDVCSSVVRAIAVDSNGMIYVTGQAAPSFPTTTSAYRSNFDGLWEAFVAKIDPTQAGLNGLLYSTYFGGVKHDDGYAIAVDNAGLVYITGSTDSNDLPTTAGALDRVCGTDGNCNPTTVCDGNFPPRCYTDPKTDLFVAKMDLTKSGAASLLYSTYVGGSGQDVGRGLAVDAAGNAYVTGYTWSPDFPLASPLDDTYGDHDDIFLLKLSANGAQLPFSTYIGGGGIDHGYALALAPDGSVYLTGFTGSGAFPVVNPLLDRSADWEAFITKVTIGAQAPAPGAFNKSAPANGANGVPLNLTLSWASSANAEGYEYCYDTTNDNACSNWTSVTATTVNLSQLSKNTTYYWQVRAFNNSGTTYANGNWYSFTTTTISSGNYKLFLPAIIRQ